MNVGASLFAHAQAAEPVEDGQALLYHPAVAPQPLGRVDSGPSNTRGDAALTQASAIRCRRVALVAVHLGRPSSRLASAPTYGRHRVDQGKQLAHIGTIGRRQAHRERTASAVDEKMMLTARLRSVRRVGARCSPLLRARTLEESAEARRRSSRPFLRNSASNSRWSACHTPAWYQSRSRRQHVMPLTPNTSRGSSSHWMPVFSTKMMPRKHALSSAGGRPPLGLGGRAGSRGWMRRQNASGTSSRRGMPRRWACPCQVARFC